MKNINDNIDEKGRQIWILCTEKDSPHYGKDYSELWDSAKLEHDLYVQGKVSHMNPEIAEEIQEKISKDMVIYKREHLKKQHASEEEAKKVIFTA